MEKKFTSDEVPLSQLLGQAASGELQLPDFQRGWVWDDDHIQALLVSISLSYPIGAVMTLQTGNADVRFRPRPLEGAEPSENDEPELLLLDGQQRLTSLFLALSSKDPVPTRNSKGVEYPRHYYADIRRCIDTFADREEDGIVSVPADRVVRSDFGRQVDLDLSTLENEIEQEMFPLDIVLDSSATMQWQMAYCQPSNGDQSGRFERWQQFYGSVIEPFVHYQVPVIKLHRSTPKEAVCQVFEKVNTGGVSLTVFELLTATYAADDFNLRDDWIDRRERLDEFPTLSRYEATDFLQTVTLLASYDRRRSHLADGGTSETAPPVTCKRRDVLRLTLDEYRRWCPTAETGIKKAVQFLHKEHVFKARDVPYPTQLVPLAAILGVLGSNGSAHAAQEKLRQWFWCGVFGEMYGGSTETRFALDLPECVAWVRQDGGLPRTISESQFQAERLLRLRSRGAAAYKGLYALQMKRGGRDFRTGDPIDVNSYFDNNIDIHHVFPRAWCESNGIPREDADSVVNKTAIDAHTNRSIGKRAPSDYLARIETTDKTKPEDLDALLASHDIDAGALRNDDFGAFFAARFEALLGQIESATGKAVNRSADGSDNPYAAARDEPDSSTAIDELRSGGETNHVEFKSTARRNLHTNERDPNIEWSTLKTVAAFLNSKGGDLLIGVDNAGSAVGIEPDYGLVQGHDRDGWELWLVRAITESMGQVAASDIDLTYAEIDDKTVARVKVQPSSAPIFAKPPKGSKIASDNVFMARLGNASEPLEGHALLDYRFKRWPT